MAKITEIVSSNPILAAAQARQAQLQAELTTVNGIIASMSGESAPQKPSSKGKRGRPKGSKNKSAKAARKTTTKATAKRKTKSESGKRGRPKGSRNRSTNGMSLIRAVATVLAEATEPLKVSQIVEGVAKLGYTSEAASFNVMVSQTLGKLSEAKVAENVKRGVWQSSNGISNFLESLTAEAAEPAEPAAETATA